jgi:hypothetical protein
MILVSIAVTIFIGFGLLYVLGMILEHFIEDFLL